ncbi:MAG: polyribonucleotide nucleotidyltransferase [Candidatus Gastranaerophilales bacterium]|nr:polyribonucleotide nucleotidyltransferase [Candidatus Gastranaerophilales bacterium]
MNENVKSCRFEIGGKEVVVETGKLAKQASGAVTIRVGDTLLLVTATVSENPRPGIDFFPLTVDYEEKMSAVGKIPGGFLRKEGRPGDKAILASRLIDRPIRPLFPKGFRNDVQITAQVFSSDQSEQPDVLAILAASFALSLSGAPFEGPIGAARIGRIDGNMVVNPTYNQVDKSDMNIVIAGTEDSVIMVEAGLDFVSEDDIMAAVDLAQAEIKKQVAMQKQFMQECGKAPVEFVNPYDTTELAEFISNLAYDIVSDAYHNFDNDYRRNKLKEAKELVAAKLEELPEEHSIKVFIASSPLDFVSEEFKSLEKKIMRKMITDEGTRADGRNPQEVRPIWVEVGVLPRAHGSAVFTRGQTQVLSVCTVAGPSMAQELDGIDPQTKKRYMHSYAFPGYSVGEAKPLRGAGRREIGHGALAERAIIPSLPSEEECGYAIRVTSDVIESNGSTSMASTCGSSLALMDAGIPVKTMIGGVAMGLIQESSKITVLTDIQGIEDFLGDMDFKVTGNETGITALQMDMKIKGISRETLTNALYQAKDGRLHILSKMKEVISAPREEMSDWAPKIMTFKIPVDCIGGVIGPGGKTIRNIIDSSGATIDIVDDGTVTITSVDQEGANIAKSMVDALALKLVPGLVSKGVVTRILPIGAIVEIAPGKDGMVHISQIAQERVNQVEDYIKLGDRVIVKVTEVDDRGRTKMTIKGVTDEEKAALG